ncbi:MAG: phosphopantetheine-binding protein [Planctomycetaceae bacterium]|jgi:3-oxoacyl-(acyl-carrier-protein) synthase/acyl carrier protein|nr:phosphopantetheine-binding protein [Planctomycetaceae bacterium]
MKNTTFTAPVAIVGLGFLLPGASDKQSLWKMISTDGSGIVRVPDSQFDRSRLFDSRKGVVGFAYSDLAGLVDYSVIDTARIANAFPFLSIDEVNKLDQSHVAYASTVVDAIDSAGICPMDLADQSAGVYIGHATPSGLGGDYNFGILVPEIVELLRDMDSIKQENIDADKLINTLINMVRQKMPRRSNSNNPELSANAIAKYISRAYHLHGPAMVFNSSCASSLQAFAHAVKSIRRGEVATAIVGGASCFHVNTSILFSLAHSLSASGSSPFTEQADGLIIGEGYVTVILKSLPHALRDGNSILALVRGVGISSDGKGKSLWAPRSEGQIESIRRAYSDSKVLEGLQYIECHATSTHLGDATELESLTTVFRESNLNRFRIPHSLPIGSIKRHVGHTLENSGLAGLAKILVQMEYESIPAIVSADSELNRSVDWSSIPVFPPSEPIDWSRDNVTPRRAAVSSFGIGGLNVHVVVEDYIADKVFSYGGQSVNDESTSIAIIGTGLILPGAKSYNEFKTKLNDGNDVRVTLPKNRWNKDLYEKSSISENGDDWRIQFSDTAIVENYNYDWKRHKVPPKQLAQASPLQFMFLDAVDQSLQNAGYIDAEGNELKPIPRERTGCIVGTFFGGDFASQLELDLRVPDIVTFIENYFVDGKISADSIKRICEEFRNRVYSRFPALIDETGSFTASSLASRITKSYNLMGGGVAIDADERSVGSAINCCLDMLLDQSTDMMFCLCGEQNITPERFRDMQLNNELEQPTEKITPLGNYRTGIVPSEGCVVFLLKRLADAKRDGDPIFGILHSSITAMKASTAIKGAKTVAGSTDVVAVEVVHAGKLENETSAVLQVRRYYPQCPVDTRIDQFGYMPSASAAVALLTAIESLDQYKLPVKQNKFIDQVQQDQKQQNAIPLKTSINNEHAGIAIHVIGRNHSIQHFIVQRGTSAKKIIETNIPTITTISTISTVTEKNATVTQQKLFNEVNKMKQVIHFDATERRRERLRKEAALRSINQKQTDVAPTIMPTPIANTINITKIQPVTQTEIKPETKPQIKSNIQTETKSAVQLPTETNAKSKISADEIESFLINFVIDQTGYPPEVVDLDVDLESDLGIDSIKKAQLFGEIGQYFDIKPNGDLTLDQFPTLRSVKDFLLGNSSSTINVAQNQSQTAQISKPEIAPVINNVTNNHVTPTESTKRGLNATEIESFLIDFVIDQTGYPPEVVDLDVDLESDLGIDSIKKAQLFGEIGQYFDIKPSSDLTIDQFPTLRSVKDFLLGNASSTINVAQNQSQPAHVSKPEITPVTNNVTNNSATFVESTKRGMDATEVESFLINFVIDQTGYPPEVVDLDVDLESDLGIDSIKKAQLFGEIGQYFDIKPSNDLTLDQFPTLRSVKDFLLQK